MNPAPEVLSPRRRAWPVLLLSALLLVLGLQLMLDRQRPRAPAPVAAGPLPAPGASAAQAVASSALPASAPEPQWGQAGEAAARVARAASAALATARAAAGLPVAAPTEWVVDLCGVGRLSLPVSEGGAGPADPAAIWARLPASMGETARQQALPRVLAAMAAPGQPERARAAAAVWQALGPSGAPAGGTATASPATTQATRTLARLARTSRDPTVRVWALAACSRETAASAECRRLQPRDLARLAPDDGLHWLRLAAAPGTPAAARAEALQRAGQADRFGSSGAALAQAIDAAWPDELPGYLRLQLLREAHALETTIQRPALEAALNLCTAQALAEAGRRQNCEAVARRMQQDPGNLAVLETAELLGARLGWPESERQARAIEQAALSRATAWSSPTDQPLACPVLEDTRQWLGQVAADGEVQAARRRLAAQPTASRPAASKP
jgi:hypothetical protein